MHLGSALQEAAELYWMLHLVEHVPFVNMHMLSAWHVVMSAWREHDGWQRELPLAHKQPGSLLHAAGVSQRNWHCLTQAPLTESKVHMEAVEHCEKVRPLHDVAQRNAKTSHVQWGSASQDDWYV